MRVLVIEDTKRIADAIKQGLVQEGYAVDVEYDGQAGLLAGLNQPYDAIILDIMLPLLDGFEVCRQLRAGTVITPILMLTAKTQDRDVVQGLDAGADDFLGKPFSFDVLLARLRALLRRPTNLTDDDITIGDLTLSVANHTVMRGSQMIDLSKKEFSILEYMMRRGGETCSKQSIIEHVWDFDADILPNTLEVFITYLRAKVDKPFDSQLIQTVRGIGYKVERTP
ncbi:MAG TPA: response regulator transcription factor [Candidatus Microsaccharimonas sp.]|jgi:DNA-binding response OmpR family regulator